MYTRTYWVTNEGYESTNDYSFTITSMTKIREDDVELSYRVRGFFTAKLSRVKNGQTEVLNITDGEFK